MGGWVDDRYTDRQSPEEVEPTGVFQGRAHHQEGHGDADGDEDLDQFWHPAVGLVTLHDDLQRDTHTHSERQIPPPVH